MTKAELVEAMAKQSKGALTKKAAGQVLDSLFDTIMKTVKKEGRFAYPGFGTLSVRTRRARRGRHPQTGEVIKIKSAKTVGFRPAKEFRDEI